MGVPKIVQLVGFIMFSGICHLIRSEVFTAIESIKPLLETHKALIRSLENYLNTEPQNKHNNILRSYWLRYQKEDEIATKDVTRYLGNPINCYTLIKRLTRDLYFLEEKIINNKTTALFLVVEMNLSPDVDFHFTAFKRPVNVTYPDKEDFDGALWAVARLHSTYRINVTEWAGGFLQGHFNADNKTRTTVFTPMTSSDCFEVGRGLYGTQEYLEGLSWMLNALRKYTEDKEMYDVSKATIVEYISFGYYKLDYVEKTIKWTKKLIALAPHHRRMSRHLQMIESYQNRLDGEESRKNGNERKIESKSQKESMSKEMLERAHFETLCRGEVEIPQQIANRLKCRYLTETPFLRLAPIKMEQMYIEPDIVLLYDVLSDDEIDYLRNTSIPKLSRGKVKGETSFIVPSRICKTSFHSLSESRVMRRIKRRTADITGLNMDTAKELQVANYGIGGHYGPHFDAVINDINVDGDLNRVATVLFYMTDVSQGGATVFLRLGLTVYPIKGAALFWRNLHPSCERDEATIHAACPVLEGSKWVGTFWLHQLGQEFLRPCNLEYQEPAYYRNLHRPFFKEYYEHYLFYCKINSCINKLNS